MSTNFRLVGMAAENASKAIFLTGIQRSGTTMLGQIIASLSSVEYKEEPPLLAALLPMLREIPADQWKLLAQIYLFEEHMMPALAGRSINMNSHDDSFVGKVKPASEIERRLGKTWRHSELLTTATTRTCAWKSPGMLMYLSDIMQILSGIRVVVTIREPISVVASIMGKGWYSDDQLFAEKPHHWFFKRDQRANLPYWLEDDDADAFLAMSEADRACHFYIRQHESLAGVAADIADRCVIVDYQRFTAAAPEQLSAVVEKFGLARGELTGGLLDGVRPRDRQYDHVKVKLDLKNQAEQLYQACLEHAL